MKQIFLSLLTEFMTEIKEVYTFYSSTIMSPLFTKCAPDMESSIDNLVEMVFCPFLYSIIKLNYFKRI